jgi:predicted component of type VI protein secretion system
MKTRTVIFLTDLKGQISLTLLNELHEVLGNSDSSLYVTIEELQLDLDILNDNISNFDVEDLAVPKVTKVIAVRNELRTLLTELKAAHVECLVFND